VISTFAEHFGKHACFLFAIGLLAGCAGPVKNYERIDEPYLRAGGGPLVIVDVCVQQDALGDADDYHMVAESKEGARSIVAVATQYLAEKDQPVKATLVPYACGVIGPDGNTPQLVRHDLQSEAVMAPRPFAPDETVASNEALAAALNVLATAGYDRSLNEHLMLLTMGRNSPMPPLKRHTPEEIRDASTVVQKTLGAEGLIYIAVNGYSQSAGKAAAMGTGRFLFAVATGVATGIAIIPGGITDGSIMTAAAFDLKAGEIRRTSAMRGMGDPKKPDVVSDKRYVHAVLHRLLHREVPAAGDAKAGAQ
jgi:hypothetical protein